MHGDVAAVVAAASVLSESLPSATVSLLRRCQCTSLTLPVAELEG